MAGAVIMATLATVTAAVATKPFARRLIANSHHARPAIWPLKTCPTIRIPLLYFAATPGIRYLENSSKPHLLRTTSRDCKLRPVTTIHLTITTSTRISGRRCKSATQQFTAGCEFADGCTSCAHLLCAHVWPPWRRPHAPSRAARPRQSQGRNIDPHDDRSKRFFDR